MKLKAMNRFQRCVAIAFTFAIVAGMARADVNRDADVQKYIETFTKSSELEQKTASEALAWEGLSDPRIFDVIEKNLLQRYKTAQDHSDSDYAAWLAKALSYSGQEKYRATLQQVADNGGSRGLRNHAQAALEQLSSYAKWNLIITDSSHYATDKSPEINRLANMIRSKDKALQEVGARRIIEGQIKDDFLFDIVQRIVEPDLAQAWSNQDDIKSVAYMLKALALSGQPKYRATVEKAAAEAAAPKVKKYAASYLKS